MLGGFKAARRKVRLTPEALTRSYYLDDERKLPLVIEPSPAKLELLTQRLKAVGADSLKQRITCRGVAGVLSG